MMSLASTVDPCGACGEQFATLSEVFSHPCAATKRSNRQVGTVSGPTRRSGTGSSSSGGGSSRPQPSKGNQASEKQLGYLRSLIESRKPNPIAEKTGEAVAALLATKDGLPSIVASEFIEMLRKLPDNSKKADRSSRVPDGFYLFDDEVLEVKTSKAGHPYAMKLDPETGKFEYAGGAPVTKLTPEHALTIEQAAQYGRRISRCVICGLTLTDPKSIERGIGPICAAKL